MGLLARDDIDMSRITTPPPEGTEWRLAIERYSVDMLLGWELQIVQKRRYWFGYAVLARASLFLGMVNYITGEIGEGRHDAFGEEGTYHALEHTARQMVLEYALRREQTGKDFPKAGLLWRD